MNFIKKYSHQNKGCLGWRSSCLDAHTGGKVKSIMILVLMSVVGCAGPKTIQREKSVEEYRAELAAVSVADGVSAQEAQIIGENYYLRHIGMGCGGLGQPMDEEKTWKFSPHVGLAGKSVGEIRIDKVSGAISYDQGPAVPDPKDVWK